jgi:hypothetical protein
MGAALIAPVVAIVALLVIWFAVGARKAREQAKRDETLPDEPYAHREEEARRLRDHHAETRPAEIDPGPRP